MALLAEQDRWRTWAHAMRDSQVVPVGVTKADVRAAVDAVDGWCETNSASFNLALPLAYRSAASPAQKAVLLALVVMRRAGRLRAAEDG